MKTCNCCGATENQINISTYSVAGLLNNKIETVKVNICDRCSALGVTDDNEKLCAITELDCILSNNMTPEAITQIAEYMIKTGTEHTTTGNYIFYYNDLAEKFGVSKDDMINCADIIIDELSKHEEFCRDDQIIENDCFSVIFYTNYCSNIEEPFHW